ncbi:MAG: hypothetical protein RML40_02225 [Bacteroidota bacterium]|nr:hypothetical protein [Candidatus Kapabacteria bacterium]MDW8219326.1 hypothetical protein [Bacteroidota bacterium]
MNCLQYLSTAALHDISRVMLLAALACSLVWNNNYLYAQAPQFGSMRTQYQTLEWRMIEARSFDVYYHQGGEYLGQYAAAVLEESFKSVQRILGTALTDRLPVVVYTSPYEAEQSNVKEALIPFALSDINILRRSRMVVAFKGDWYEFKRDIVRELTRGIIHLVLYGAVLPPAVGGQFEVPEWCIEGLAEFCANDGTVTYETDMALRAIVSNERFATLNAVERSSIVPIGHALFWYISEKFGAGRIAEFITRVRGLRSMENAFRTTFGLSIDAFSAVWKRELKELYAPDAARSDNIEKIATRITDTDKDGSQANVHPVWSPVRDKSGAERLAYLSAQANTWHVMLYTDGKQKRLERVLSTGKTFEPLRALFWSSTSLLAWRPDGTQIAAVVSTDGADGVMLVNPTTGAQQRLDVRFRIIKGIAWSPDSKLLALAATENEATNLYLYDIATKRLSKLTNDVFTELEPTWSPDGKVLYFLSDRGANLTVASSSASVQLWEYPVHHSDIYSYTLATKQITRLTSTPNERKISLALAHDGKRLLYVSDRSGIYNVYELNLTTYTSTARSNLQYGAWDVELSRSSSLLTFSAMTKSGLNIFSLSAPFERKVSEPEPTQLRKQSMERESAAEKVLAGTSAFSEDTKVQQSHGLIVQYAPDTLRGYGRVALTFENQKMVIPNSEILSQAALQQSRDDNTFAIPGKYPTVPVEYQLGLVTWSATPTFDTFFSSSPSVFQETLLSNLGMVVQGLWMDALGDHRLFAMANLASVLLNLNNNDVLLSYTYLPQIIDYEVQLFRSGRENIIIDQREPVRVLLAYWGASGKAILPLSSDMRIEGKLAILNTLRSSDRTPRVNRSDIILAPEARFVIDNAEIGFFGPISGIRASVQIDAVPGMAGLGFVRGIGDYRQYVSIHNIGTLVARIAAGTNLGDTPQNFLAGGQENAVLGRSVAPEILPFNRAEDIYFVHPVMPLRGFSIADAQGRNFFSVNVEARVMLLRPEHTSSFLSSILYGVQAVCFVDIASAWTNPLRLNLPRAVFDTFDRYVGLAGGDLLMSLGVGIRTYAFGSFPVRVDMAWQNLQSGLMQPRLTIGFGYNF